MMLWLKARPSILYFAAIVILVVSADLSAADTSEWPEFNRDPAKARIVTEDLERFWKAWDLAEGNPDQRRAIFQSEYLDAGTPGLHAFIELRIKNVDHLLAAIDAHPRYYASLRDQTPRMQAAVEPVHEALHRLHELLPEAIFPDTYLVIGRMNSGGTIALDGLLIGAEMFGLTVDTPIDELGPWHRAAVKSVDGLPAIIVHELVHFQQAALTRAAPHSSLLGMSIHEGAADFIAELIIGEPLNQHLQEWALPREAELWAEFRPVMHDDDHSEWLYQGDRAIDRPADLGYFIGYRIVQAYYEQADDKQAAIRNILTMTNPKDFLKRSGYNP